MENNYGRLNNFNGEGKEPVITTNQTGLSRMDDLLHQNDNYENGCVKHPDDEEVQFVTKAINELDPEILAAMEHLSITDEDIMPNTTADQNDKANINSEAESSRIENYKSQIISFKDPEFTKRIAEEIIEHVQKSDSVEEGYEIIHQGVEYAKNQTENQIKQAFKAPVAKLTRENITLK